MDWKHISFIQIKKSAHNILWAELHAYAEIVRVWNYRTHQDRNFIAGISTC